MSYTPNNLTVYTAAYSGVITGFAASGRRILDAVTNDYNGYALIAGAFAQAFDLAWEANPDTTGDTLEVFIIEKACKAVWEERFTQVTSNTLEPSSYTGLCNAIIALVLAAENYFSNQGITPDPWPTSGTSVTQNSTNNAGVVNPDVTDTLLCSMTISYALGQFVLFWGNCSFTNTSEDEGQESDCELWIDVDGALVGTPATGSWAEDTAGCNITVLHDAGLSVGTRTLSLHATSSAGAGNTEVVAHAARLQVLII